MTKHPIYIEGGRVGEGEGGLKLGIVFVLNKHKRQNSIMNFLKLFLSVPNFAVCKPDFGLFGRGGLVGGGVGFRILREQGLVNVLTDVFYIRCTF